MGQICRPGPLPMTWPRQVTGRFACTREVTSPKPTKSIRQRLRKKNLLERKPKYKFEETRKSLFSYQSVSEFLDHSEASTFQEFSIVCYLHSFLYPPGQCLSVTQDNQYEHQINVNINFTQHLQFCFKQSSFISLYTIQCQDKKFNHLHFNFPLLNLIYIFFKNNNSYIYRN